MYSKISDGSEGKFDIKKVQAGLQYSTISDGSEGHIPFEWLHVQLQYSTISDGSEGFNKKIQQTKSNVKKRNSH